jgi:hypothetical protein
MNTNTKESRPWYRVPFMWLVMALLSSAVIGSFVSLALAIRSDDGLVEVDYYKRGMEINRVLDRDHAATAHGLESALDLDAARHEVVIRLTAHTAMAYPDNVQLKLMHATRAGFDHTLLVPRGADGAYHAPLPELAPGHWDVQITAQDWRLTGSFKAPGDSQLVMRAASS